MVPFQENSDDEEDYYICFSIMIVASSTVGNEINSSPSYEKDTIFEKRLPGASTHELCYE